MPYALALLVLLSIAGCLGEPPPVADDRLLRCPGVDYPDAATSPYVVPFPEGSAVTMGLTNCSDSFHSADRPDALAYDFDVRTGTPFLAARAGRVVALDEDEPSGGGGAGNYVLVDHGDGTSAYYLHSPEGGIDVEVGDTVAAGDRLGVVGQSGQAGYPHLHFIVVAGDPAWPYRGVPVAFRNAHPAHVPLQSYGRYTVTE